MCNANVDRLYIYDAAHGHKVFYTSTRKVAIFNIFTNVIYIYTWYIYI